MKGHPKVSIIITTYRPESKPYLDLCIESIYRLNYPKDKIEVILVGKQSYKPQYVKVKTVAPDLEVFHNPIGVNYGMKLAASDSEFVMLLNDDVILTPNSLAHMMINMPGVPCVMAAISPCDNFYKYALTFPVTHTETKETKALDKRFYSLDDLKDYVPSMLNAESLYNHGIILTDTLCMYANLIPKKLWDDLGGFDEKFGTGGDDTDFCLRAKRDYGAVMAICLSSLIWHFGGASTNHTLTPEMREETRLYFHSKWGFSW